MVAADLDGEDGKSQAELLLESERHGVRETCLEDRPQIAAAAAEALSYVREIRDYAIYMLDVEGRVLTWNEGARSIKGYSAEEILGQSFSRFFTEQDRAAQKPARLLARAAAQNRAVDGGWRVRKDGTLFWADVVLTAAHDDAGAILGFVKVTRDLTERRRTDELLRQSEERLRLLIEGVKDYAIFMLDPEGRVSTWNAGAERIKGYQASEILGVHFSKFYPQEAIAVGHPEHELQIARTSGRYEEEGWRVRKDGNRFWTSVVITAIHHPTTGELRGFAKVTRDLTERRRMEEEAQSAAEDAIRERLRADHAQFAIRVRDEFISVTAHELRTPLAALMLKLQGGKQMLQKSGAVNGEFTSKLAQRLEGALRQVRRLAELVEGLLDVSRIAQGSLAIECAEMSVTATVQSVIEDFHESAVEVGSVLRFESKGNAVGHWDRARIEQVVVNLLANAIKYGKGQPVDVSVECTEDGARIVVTDYGIGIAPDDVPRIFKRFERAVPVQHYGGIGLGLYIARSIVEAHGGTIRVFSEPGKGATFVVELPTRGSVAQDAAATKPAEVGT